MGRVERRQYRMRRRQTTTRFLLVLSLLVIAAGLYHRMAENGGVSIARIVRPTATPVAPAYDETMVEREVTLPEETWYALQTGVFSDEKSAKARAEAYAERGAPGLVVQDGERFRVFIAGYAERADAASIRERLNSQQDVETYLYSWVCPAVTLKMSGMAGQVDVVESGLSMALQAAVLLRDYAIAYDQGGVTMDDVQSLIQGLDSQFLAWTDTVGRRFGKPYPEIITEEMALVQCWKSADSAILSAAQEGATAMSASMKRYAMTLYADVIDMRNRLEST